jgi:hypothetical protein
MQAYPLTLIFDLWAVLPNKITVKDLMGITMMRVERALTLKHKVEVTAYRQRSQPQVYQVEAENLALNPAYDIWDRGQTIGQIQRQDPWWKCHYNIYDGQRLTFRIEEENPRSLTALILVSAVTVSFIGMKTTVPSLRLFGIGLFGWAMLMLIAIGAGYLFNPIYTVKRPNGRVVMRFAKVPSLHPYLSKFSIKAIDMVNDAEESKALLGIILLILRERGKN